MADLTDNVNKNDSAADMAALEKAIAEGVTKHQANATKNIDSKK